MSGQDEKPAAEDTDAGSQTLMGGVAPITMHDRLGVFAAAPMAPHAAQKRCDHGLFDTESRRQIDLVDELRRLTHNDDLTSPITNNGE